MQAGCRRFDPARLHQDLAKLSTRAVLAGAAVGLPEGEWRCGLEPWTDQTGRILDDPGLTGSPAALACLDVGAYGRGKVLLSDATWNPDCLFCARRHQVRAHDRGASQRSGVPLGHRGACLLHGRLLRDRLHDLGPLTGDQGVPGQLPRPPGRPPAEPIIIRTPPRPHDDLEIEIPDGDDDRGGEIRRPPRWAPDPPPPAPPEQRTRSSIAPPHRTPSAPPAVMLIPAKTSFTVRIAADLLHPLRDTPTCSRELWHSLRWSASNRPG